jgi:Tfp pilus assembly protein PilF
MLHPINECDRVDRMMLKYFRVGLISLSISLHPVLMANLPQHSNYYQSQSSTLLENTEKFHLQQALHKLEQQDHEHAWSELAFVLHYFPNHPRALALLCELSLKMEQSSRATRYLERAIQLYPEEAATYGLFGQFLMQNAKYTDAVAQFKKAILLDNLNSNYHYQLSLAYLALQNYALANKEAQLAQFKGHDIAPLKEKLLSVDAWKPTKKQGA